jgi:hypothetical protein
LKKDGQVRVLANGASGVESGSPNDDGRTHTGTGQNSAPENSRANGSRQRTIGRRALNEGSAGHASARGPAQNGGRLTPTGGFHGHWLGVGAASLPGQIKAASDYPDTANVLGAATGTTMTAAEYLARINKGGSQVLNGVYRGAMWAGLVVNTGMDLYNLGVDARQLGENPDSEQAKWRLANSAVRLFANGAALALMPLAPVAAFAPLMLPDFGEIGRAADLSKQKTDLERKGQQTEANATGQSHTLAALNATPIVNWFAPFYQNALTPDVEKFEHAHGNFDGQPPPAELPGGSGNNPTVTDYYANAMKERAGRVAENMTPFLRDAARKSGTEYVTLISHWPQTFCWPSSGNPMRTFDRAIVLTYSRKTDTVIPTFFGRDFDGSFRAPPNNHDIPLQQSSQHLFYFSRMLDPGKQEEMLKLHE